MANTKKNRSELKSYFVKNSIPTESNFADLIDGMLNLQDDRISKLPGDPLSIEASGDSAGLQKVINFYTKFDDPNAPNPAWSLQLNPQTEANGSKTSNAGFCVADGQSGVSRLFIDKKTGHLGLGTNSPGARLDVVADSVIPFQGWNEAIRLSNKDNSAITHPSGGLLFGLHGTGKFYFADTNKQKYLMVIDANNAGQVGIGTSDGAAPIAKLDIAQAPRTGKHPTAIKGLYITGDFGIDTDGVEFRHSNGTQGIGLGYNTIYAAGNNVNQDLQLKSKGQGMLRVLSDTAVSGNLVVSGGIFLSTVNPDFSIAVCGSAFDSETPDATFVRVEGVDMDITIGTGLNTVILNSDGSFKNKANHAVYPTADQWNVWADWVNTNAVFGDIVAVASHDAINNAPKGGTAEVLLSSIQATKVFSAVPLATTLPRAPYALLFVKGRSAVEILGNWFPKTPFVNPTKPNAQIKTTYQRLLNLRNQWITPALQSNWVNYDTNFNPAQFRKDSEDVVWLRGLIRSGTLPALANNASLIFTLPEGYRPTNRQLHGVCTSESVMGRVDVLQNGNVVLVAGSNIWTSLDGIAFRTAPLL